MPEVTFSMTRSAKAFWRANAWVWPRNSRSSRLRSEMSVKVTATPSPTRAADTFSQNSRRSSW
ncbi:hypothetical protein D3C72_1877190 [compost metagenome]